MYVTHMKAVGFLDFPNVFTKHFHRNKIQVEKWTNYYTDSSQEKNL